MTQLNRYAAIVGLLLLTPIQALAQIPLNNSDLSDPFVDPPNLEEPEFPPEDPAELQFEPPSLPAPLPPETLEDTPFRVSTIELRGMTVDPNQLSALFEGENATVAERITALEGQNVTLRELFALRSFITQAYINAGYITSGAFLPEQAFTDGGSVQIQVVEGDLEAIEIGGLSRLQDYYVRDRINLRVDQPIRQQDIEEALQLLQLDPILDRVDAQLVSGSGPGQSILTIDLIEANPWSYGFSINNYRSPSAGEVQVSPYLSYANLLGWGDRLDLSYNLTDGLDNYGIEYTVPVNAMDGTINVNFSSSNSRIIEGNFSLIGIRSESRTLSLGMRQPLILTPTTEFALGLSLDLRRSQTFLLDDIPFSFSVGPENGESRVTVVRFSQDWVNRSSNRVLAARSQFSFGLDALGSTINNTGTDGSFFSWLGQFQWVERLPEDSLFPPNSVLVTRISGQLTPDSLLPLEQFSLGGVSTVRGYRDNQLVTDNGVTASLELRIPLSANPTELQITPFVEAGMGWNSQETGNVVETLASAGLGLRWAVDPNVQIRLDYGYPLSEVSQTGSSFQDNGFYFSIDMGF